MATTTLDAATRLIASLRRSQFSPILGYSLTSSNARQLDLSVHNEELQKIGNDATFVNSLDRENFVWLGGYGEERNIYSKASLFATNDRCIHLGVDVTLKPDTPLFAPLAGRVHSFQNNDKPFDYGPTIILEHDLDGNVHFHTLYGHLTLSSLANLTVGQEIAPGELVGRVGYQSENGGWNPHVHFQIITDMQGNRGDYPGVASKAEASAMLRNCPDPQFILGFPDKPVVY